VSFLVCVRFFEMFADSLNDLRWGCHPWSGTWSRTSDLWTPKLKQELGFQDKDDGSFWMSYEDFITRFAQIDVLHCHSNWYSGSQQLEIPVEQSVADRSMEIRVSEPTWLYVSILQPGKRGKADVKFWYADISLIVIRERMGDFAVVEQIRLSAPRRSAHLELMLDDPNSTYHLFFFSISREVGIRDPAVMTPDRKRVVKLDQTVKFVARLFGNKPVSMKRSGSMGELFKAVESSPKPRKKAAVGASGKGNGKAPQMAPERSDFLNGLFGTVLATVVDAAREKGTRQQGFSSLGQPDRVQTKMLGRNDMRLDVYEAAGMALAVVENRSPTEAVMVRMLLHAPDIGATNIIKTKKPKAKKETKPAPQGFSGGYRLDGTPVVSEAEASAAVDVDSIDEDGRRWEYVPPSTRSVVAAVPMPHAWEEDMLGYSLFALDRLEFETWKFGMKKELDEAMGNAKGRSFTGPM